MTPAEIIQSCDFDGVKLALTPEGKLHYSGNAEMIAQWLPTLRENRRAILAELHRESRRCKVRAMLQEAPDTRYALHVDDNTSDPVVCAVAIRDAATFELAIPHHSYNPFVLIELLEKQLSGETQPTPDTNKRNTVHPGGLIK
ncbi:MAG: hypothetical protein DID92_2727745642 [Candidatus Nitrotoga sp. SPKER]|nr:MAG: hypothetical protein DID92_2727745642 [Candidatus Nitrotoga sp. SPKER]